MNLVFSIISLFFLNFGTVVVDETCVLNYPIEHENVIGIDKESFIVNNNNGSYLIFEENEFFVSTGDVIDYVTMLDRIVLLVDNGNDSNIITFNETTLLRYAFSKNEIIHLLEDYTLRPTCEIDNY